MAGGLAVCDHRRVSMREHNWNRGKLSFTPEMIIKLLILTGCILRIYYAAVTPVTLRGHDIWEISADAKGKAAYLLRLVEWGKLPDSYDLQFYHQPFYYMLSALAAVIMRGLTGITDAAFLVNGGKVISCIASCGTLFLTEYLLKEFCPVATRVYGMVILSFTPVFWLTGGRLGEDALTCFFMVAVILWTVRWEKQPDWKNTVILAVLYGCGMMTKISLAFPAFYTAYIFWKKRKSSRFVLKMGVFALLSLPLGLWYSVRNFILFGQPFGYVLRQGENLYRGSYSYVARFFSFDLKNWLSTPYANPYKDYNFPVYLLKSELFGEFTYDVPVWLPALLLLFSTLLTLCVAGIGIYKICKWKSLKEDRRPLIFGLLFGGYAMISYLRLPFGCSMDFRYYMMLAVCKALVLCCFLNEQTEGRFVQEKLLLQKGLKVLCALLAAFSMFFFVLIQEHG